MQLPATSKMADISPLMGSSANSPGTPNSSNNSTSSPSADDFQVALVRHLMAPLDLDQILSDLIEIARTGGQMMIDAAPTTEDSDEKRNSSDRVTETDKAVEAMVKETLARKYPQMEFLGEETFKEGQTLQDEATFVCDPIDGTLNFCHGPPWVAISLALTVAKEPVVGVVYNPFRDDLFTAIKGRGAFLTSPSLPWSRGKPVQLPTPRKPTPLNGLRNCLVAYEYGSIREGPIWDLRLRTQQKLLSAPSMGGSMCHSIRTEGSAALAMCKVAAGWNDMFWEAGCWIWDVCAGWLIVTEAGGMVVGANPDEWKPSLEGRSYFAVRGAPTGQHELIEEVWTAMEGSQFDFTKPIK
jgi:myo-inositol-1(or 4)-monophosphatase